MGISNASRGLCQLTHGLRENASQFLGNWKLAVAGVAVSFSVQYWKPAGCALDPTPVFYMGFQHSQLLSP
jgi:hypothetical protein